MPKRFSPAMESDHSGDWVEYSEYIDLQTTVNELREQITDLENLVEAKNNIIKDYAAEVDSLERALRRAEENS